MLGLILWFAVLFQSSWLEANISFKKRSSIMKGDEFSRLCGEQFMPGQLFAPVS